MKNFKNIIRLALVIIIIAGYSIFTVSTSKANPVAILPTPCTSGTGTSTTAQVGVAVGTSTLTYDSYGYYSNCTLVNSMQPIATEGATLFIQGTGSTSAAILNLNIQYSQDGVDWYGDFINRSLVTNSSSTAPVFSINTPYSYTWTSIGTSTKLAIPFLTPTRFARVIATGLTATTSIWMQIVPLRQVKQ